MVNKIAGWKQSIGKAKQRFLAISKMARTDMVWDREAMFAMQAIEKSSELQKCPPDSIRDAIINVASIGLSLSPAEKLAYLVPRDRVAVLDISYQGLLKLATDSGAVVWAKVELVYEQDEFEYLGMDRSPVHKISNPFVTTRGPLIGAYCVAKLSNGDKLVEVMGIDDIHKIRNTSKAYTRKKNGKDAPSGPWVTWYEEMVKKTVLKRAYKSWPKTRAMSEAVHVLNQHEGVDFDATPAPHEDGPALLINEEELKTLQDLIKESGVNPARILKAFEIKALSDLPADQFDECKARLDAALAVKKQKEQENQGETGNS